MKKFEFFLIEECFLNIIVFKKFDVFLPEFILLMKFFFPIFLFFYFTSLNAQTGAVKARAFLDSTQFTIGDKITIHEEVTTPTPENFDLKSKPNIVFDTTAFEIKNYSEWKDIASNDGLTHKQMDITLLAWDTGVYKIDVIPFIFSAVDFPTDTLTVSVKYPSDLSTMTAPQPIKDIIREESVWEDYLPFLIPFFTALVLAFILWRAWKYYKNKETVVAPVIQKIERAPRELALQQLQDLKKKKYPEAENTKQYYTELSDIVRTYIENQYRIPALESTTDEIFKRLNKKLSSSNKMRNLRDALSIADLAKFAQVTPTLTTCEQHWQYVFDFIGE